MTEPAGTILSVRGSAQRSVPPDFVHLSGTLRLLRPGKAEALAAAAEAQRALIEDVAPLGGAPRTDENERSALTWYTRAASTHPERRYDRETGESEPTGQVIATVAVVITVRDFALLRQLDGALAGHENFALHETAWGVDEDNPVWNAVRAAAIHAALRKGGDYAGALGSAIVRIEQVADVGLLGGDPHAEHRRSPMAVAITAAGGADRDVPTLDPVPQELSATIEARLLTTAVDVGSIA